MRGMAYYYNLVVYVPRDRIWLVERLKEEAQRRGMTVSRLILEILMKELGGGGR